mgnify:CR=1 FL=1
MVTKTGTAVVIYVDGVSVATGTLIANNTLTGGAGDDTMVGGAGIDTLLGGDNDDVLLGGTAVDVLDGGLGENTVIQDGNTLNAGLVFVLLFGLQGYFGAWLLAHHVKNLVQDVVGL